MERWLVRNGESLPDAEALFQKSPVHLACFCALTAAVAARWPECALKVHRTQVSFCDPRPFCYAWVRSRRFYVTFGLDAPLKDPRVSVAVEPYPNRWTHHVALSGAEEVDDQLLAWIERAWRFKRGADR